MMGVVAGLSDAEETAGARLEPERFVLNVEPGIEPPPIKQLVGAPYLDAVDVPFHHVAPLQGKDGGGRDLDALQIVIDIVECRNRQGRAGRQLPAVADFISGQLFRLEVRSAGQEYYRAELFDHVAIERRRRPYRAGCRCP